MPSGMPYQGCGDDQQGVEHQQASPNDEHNEDGPDKAGEGVGPQCVGAGKGRRKEVGVLVNQGGHGDQGYGEHQTGKDKSDHSPHQ